MFRSVLFILGSFFLYETAQNLGSIWPVILVAGALLWKLPRQPRPWGHAKYRQ